MAVILIIDDDKFILKVVDKLLSSKEYRVFTAQEGKKGIETAKSANPDLILLDINMPELDGFQVLKHLRKNSITKNTPVVMLTAVTEKDAILNAMRQGVLDYIIKPFDNESFLDKVKSALKYSTMKREERAADRTENIYISRDSNTILISFKENLREKKVIQEAKKVFNPFFFRTIKKHSCVLDLRALTSFGKTDVALLRIIIKLFGNREVLIVAGRHYGAIVADLDFDEIGFGERVQVFISFGDLQIFFKKKGGQ